jgi:hypothetical protein
MRIEEGWSEKIAWDKNEPGYILRVLDEPGYTLRVLKKPEGVRV